MSANRQRSVTRRLQFLPLVADYMSMCSISSATLSPDRQRAAGLFVVCGSVHDARSRLRCFTLIMQPEAVRRVHETFTSELSEETHALELALETVRLRRHVDTTALL